MSKFSHLKQYDPAGKRVWYPLPIKGGAELELRHAGMGNKPYAIAVSNENQRTGNARRSMEPSELTKANLDIDRVAFPGNVVVGWRNVTDSEGNEVAFSLEECKAFLAELPDWIIQSLSIFAGRATNFIDPTAPSREDVLEQAGE